MDEIGVQKRAVGVPVIGHLAHTRGLTEVTVAASLLVLDILQPVHFRRAPASRNGESRTYLAA